MNRFLQLHLLTSYGPANLNRDDSGRPKTAIMGGETRLRVSSQSLKRAWRTSEVFEEALAGHIGTRTKRAGVKVYERLVAGGVKDKDARKWAQEIAAVFGKLKKARADDAMNDLEIEQLAHFSPSEWQAVESLADALIARGGGPEREDLELLRKEHRGVDIALFGRMLADSPAFNTEAAVQVAHAIAVHRCVVDDDFFTAVDDLNDGSEDAGAGHMGATEFGAAVYYLYLCVDRQLLLEHLGGDRDLAGKALQALLEAAATVAPTGKQNSFASRARASYVLAEKGDSQPRQLSVAFLKPVQGNDMLAAAIEALESTRERMNKVYGDDLPAARLDASKGEGSLAGLKQFACED